MNKKETVYGARVKMAKEVQDVAKGSGTNMKKDRRE